jgi:uncharacterized protein (TIGR02996 family)
MESRGTRAADAAALLAAIHADPDDDGARQVYADLLTELDDPRGAFITMQLARAGRAAKPAMVAAERALLVEHAVGWMGALAELTAVQHPGYLRFDREDLGTALFERGFLVACSLTGSAKQLAAAAGHRELATVEDLTIWNAFVTRGTSGSKPMRQACAKILGETSMPVLRALIVTTDLAEPAMASPCASRLLRFGTSGPTSTTHVRVAEAATMPSLRELELTFDAEELDPKSRRAISAALARPKLEQLVIRFDNLEGTCRRAGKRWSLTLASHGASERQTAEIKALVR